MIQSLWDWQNITCILISIFLVWRKPNRKMGPPFPLQGEGRRRTWERESLAGPVFLLARVVHIHDQTALRPEQFQEPVLPLLKDPLHSP